MTNETLAELAMEVADAEVDGERAESLEPKYATAETIAKEAGISPDSPKYSGLHRHCQYMRTC